MKKDSKTPSWSAEELRKIRDGESSGYNNLIDVAMEMVFNNQGDENVYANLRLAQNVSGYSNEKWLTKVKAELYRQAEMFREELMVEDEDAWVADFMKEFIAGTNFKL